MGEQRPFLMNTELGWVVGGAFKSRPVCNAIARPNASCAVVSLNLLNKMLERFWEIEQFDTQAHPRSQEDEFAENHFKDTYRRDNGRFVVKLPFTHDPKDLGASRKRAEACWLNTEKKFLKSPQIKTLYDDFMDTYVALGHMIEAGPTDHIRYFIPHHCVMKESESATKFRVVFNGSAKTSTNLSLNECMPPGPRIQDDLINIVLRFRTHLVALCGDIEKMYRQVELNEEDQLFQGIIYRKSPTEPLKTYKLRTLTLSHLTATNIL